MFEHRQEQMEKMMQENEDFLSEVRDWLNSLSDHNMFLDEKQKTVL